MNRLRDARFDGSAENLSLSCDPGDSGSTEGIGESNEDVMVHSLVDVSVDILIFSHVKPSSTFDFY